MARGGGPAWFCRDRGAGGCSAEVPGVAARGGHRGESRDTELQGGAPYLSPEQGAGTALFWAEVKE